MEHEIDIRRHIWIWAHICCWKDAWQLVESILRRKYSLLTSRESCLIKSDKTIGLFYQATHFIGWNLVHSPWALNSSVGHDHEDLCALHRTPRVLGSSVTRETALLVSNRRKVLIQLRIVYGASLLTLSDPTSSFKKWSTKSRASSWVRFEKLILDLRCKTAQSIGWARRVVKTLLFHHILGGSKDFGDILW